MSVVIRLKRAGAKNRPYFRIVAADSRRQRDGRFLEILGHYDPVAKPYELVVHKDKVEAWLTRGAQPSEQVASLLRTVGIFSRRRTAPRKKAAAAAGTKKAVKRAVRRVPSARKLKAKAARKARKAGAAQAAAGAAAEA
jgi:small subunit ribosomal protein S16